MCFRCKSILFGLARILLVSERPKQDKNICGSTMDFHISLNEGISYIRDRYGIDEIRDHTNVDKGACFRTFRVR